MTYFKDTTNKVTEQIDTAQEEFQNQQDSLKKKREQLCSLEKHWVWDEQPVKLLRQSNEWWADVIVEDQNAALVLMERMNPHSMFLVRDGWTAFAPEPLLDAKYPVLESLSELNRTKYGVVLIDPYYYEIRDNFDNFDHSILFWITCGTELVKVRIVITNPNRQDRGVDFKHEDYMGGSRIYNVRPWDKSGMFNTMWSPARGSDDSYPRAYFCRG